MTITEINLLNNAEELYQRQQLPFGSIYIDVPLALETELTVLSNSGFSSISVKKDGIRLH